ncbi:alpha/beta hydrolase family protein [Flavobacterium wongokense]|uniref:alpha/beta hydrolase family protein n=1 Tax=Flavobacterium wongokense TaxID=2910674 RepID=UPI001F1BD3ED|nr:prolyl oligopeptidase family serine peptidase [Flavobacterium sp. WG47]MCF6132734.1 prolyl oligopeptidase family serine peptidase [Flavobacterium sp. WG47]
MRDINKQLIFIVFFVFVTCSLVGQVSHKKALTEKDYALWSTMEIKGSSAKGLWVSYNLTYESGNDTLVIRNKDATKVYAFAKGKEGIFGGDRWFACSLPENKILIQDLQNGKREEIVGVRKFDIANDGKTIVVLQENNLLTITYSGRPFAKIEHVTDFVPNTDKTGMVYTIEKEKSSLHYCLFDGIAEHFKIIANEAGVRFEDITWQKNGNALAFRKRYAAESDARNGTNVYLYQLNKGKIYSLDLTNAETRFLSGANEKVAVRSLVVSDDSKRVFFYTQTITPDQKKPIVQVWNGNDPWTYSQDQLQFKNRDKYWFAWWPDANRVVRLTDDDRSYVMLTRNKDFAITYNPRGDTPQFSLWNKFRWSVTDLRYDKAKFDIPDEITEADEITPSYGGKYILYRIAENWLAYDLLAKKRTDLTVNFPKVLIDQSDDRAGIKPWFNLVGWTNGDKELLVCDEYDIWSIRLSDLKTARLTKGREKEIIYRVVMPFGKTNKDANFDGFTYPLFHPDKGFYLKAKGKLSKQSGFYWWNGVEQPLVYNDKAYNDLCFNMVDDILYCTEEDFDMPRRVLAISRKADIRQVVFESNLQHSAYLWGRSELITYTDNSGNRLQGALFYPAAYDKRKKYPMVVFIYERKSSEVHDYVNPSVYNGGVINISNLTSQGYLVLLPDIKYKLDNVGFSATECVVNATKVVIGMGIVQPDRIALMGHSFGGYEAAFIATQTDIFATVIPGAAVTDVVSSYLSVGWNQGRSEIWRYEDHQWRMTKSLFADMETYLRNSPITHVKNISVPILLWTGELDRQVHYYQSIEFYNALRRLGKKVVMLIYPGNRHRLTNPESEAESNRRLEQWFETFLKSGPAPDWIRKAME